MCNVTWRGSHISTWTSITLCDVMIGWYLEISGYIRQYKPTLDDDIRRHWAILCDFATPSRLIQGLHGSESIQKWTNFKPCAIYTVGPFAHTEPTWMNSPIRQYNCTNSRPKANVVMVSLPARFQNRGHLFARGYCGKRLVMKICTSVQNNKNFPVYTLSGAFMIYFVFLKTKIVRILVNVLN